MSEALNREYHELIGYWFQSYGNGGGFWHRAPKSATHQRAANSFHCDGCDGNRLMPELHLDANLCIAELDRVFDVYVVTRRKNGQPQEWEISTGVLRRPVQLGATFTEAALKCLIAAHKRESEAG